jgi:hypothetical protein
MPPHHALDGSQSSGSPLPPQSLRLLRQREQRPQILLVDQPTGLRSAQVTHQAGTETNDRFGHPLSLLLTRSIATRTDASDSNLPCLIHHDTTMLHRLSPIKSQNNGYDTPLDIRASIMVF